MDAAQKNSGSNSQDYGLPIKVPSTITEKSIRVRVLSAVEGPLSGIAMAPVFIMRQVTANVVADKASIDGWVASVLVDLRNIEVEGQKGTAEIGDIITDLEYEHIVSQVRKQLFGLEKNLYAKLDITNVIPLKASNGEGVYLRGVLEINGRRNELSFPMIKNGDHYDVKFTFKQSEYGFKPMQSFKGALRASDMVTVEVTYQPNAS